MALLNNVVAGLLILTVVRYAVPETVRVTDPFQISPYTHLKTNLSNVEPVPGRRSCGGTGRVVGARYEQCNTGGSEMCVLSHEGIGRAEMVFVPSASSKGFVFIFRMFTTGGGEPQAIILEHKFPKLAVVAGQEYVLTAAGGPTPELAGKHVTAQWELYRMIDRQVEVCSEADLYVI